MQRPWVSYEELADARWFQRGWTLQELLAPDNVQFFDADWAPIGSLRSLEEWVAEITGIDERALSKKWPVKCFSTAQKFSWASRRVTTIDEDKAYCLVGLFSVSLAPEYGITGRRAFHLLQEAIIRQSCELDESIFVWDTDDDSRQDELFANSPKDFQNGGDIEYDFDQRVPSSFVWSGGRLHGDFRLLRSDPRLDKWDGCVALLNCKLRDQDEKQLGLCLKPVETGHNSRRHRSRTGPTYAVNPRPRRNRSCRTVLIDQLRTIDTFPYRISVVTSVLKTRHDYPLGTMSAHLRRVESLIQLGEGDHGSRPQSRLSENVLWSRAFRNDQHTAVSGYDTTSDVPARSAPPGFKKRRISRPLDESESAAFAAFEIHARECPDCYNPGEVLLAGGELCRTGRSLGNSVGSYAFYRKGKIVGREGSDTLQIFLELPQYYQQVWDYLST
ncbi:Vegetative incompatibility protein HET-E-1 [Pseudocercospora fuligena]|uniref:Vegetative incompatibility protein HET-E-1 n=1 Tax=Pseudocercospora fuligena TaxID=685502 RepID=A0A8H6VHM6_9PEZI|nr:Vegetative incompatibility protein HET-E-1 [Pseudocercospora fuligena]